MSPKRGCIGGWATNSWGVSKVSKPAGVLGVTCMHFCSPHDTRFSCTAVLRIRVFTHRYVRTRYFTFDTCPLCFVGTLHIIHSRTKFVACIYKMTYLVFEEKTVPGKSDKYVKNTRVLGYWQKYQVYTCPRKRAEELGPYPANEILFQVPGTSYIVFYEYSGSMLL